MKYNTLIFDLDGTLLNTLDDLADSMNYALDKCGFPERSRDEIRSFVGNGIPKLIERSVPEGTDEAGTEKCLSFFRERYDAHAADKTAPYEGIVSMLKKAKSMGMKTAVVTNKSHDTSAAIIKEYFGELIDVTLGHKPGARHKPYPDGVLEIVKSLGSEIPECIYIGDSDVDCLTGHNAGMPVIGVTWGFRGRHVLEEAGADFVVDRPESIFECLV